MDHWAWHLGNRGLWGPRKVAIYQPIWRHFSNFTTVPPHVWKKPNVSPDSRDQAEGGGKGRGMECSLAGLCGFSRGKRHSPWRLTPISHWATASHMSITHSKGQAFAFPGLYNQRRQGKGSYKWLLESQFPIFATAYQYGLGRTQ